MAGGEFPEDVLSDILSRLPVKSLMRFRCVCKLWYALLKNPDFISLHLSRASLRRKSDHLLMSCRLPDYPNYVFTIHSGIETLDDLSVNLVVPFLKKKSWIDLMGPSNGIVCIHDYRRNRIVLSNPATREFRALPVPLFTYPDHSITYIGAVGFGFDPKTSDYKVVRVLKLFIGQTICYSTKTEVYSLSTNCWRQIETHPCAHIDQLPWSTTLFNGAFHWCAKLDANEGIIVSFHMSDEVFRQIPLPNFCSRRGGYDRGLAVLNESLALILFGDKYSQDPRRCFDIWVMNACGCKGSWTRCYKIRPRWGIIISPVAILNSSELLMDTSDGQLVSFNLYDQNVKGFEVDGVQGMFQVVTYSESFVSIEGGNVV